MGPADAPSAEQDRSMVEAVLAREPGAFEALVRAYQGLCWHVIGRMVRHPEDARELSQETFLRVFRHLHQYRFESPLRSWIGQVAYSVALRHVQRKGLPLVEADDVATGMPRLEEIAGDVDIEAASVKGEAIALLREEIEVLPPLQRTLLTLYHMDEIPIPEIATITGLAVGTIKSHLFRSRARLRERLAARLGGLR
jgi:RNA polymerase sigma-70 factor (ECF subfamily)